MAAKKKAQPVKAKAAKAKKTTAAKKKKTPTAGMDAAQVKAYNNAASASTKAQRTAANAVKYRQKRVATAKRTTAAAARQYKAAASSRAVQYAVTQTWKQTVSGHQSTALRAASAKRVFNATRIASSRKFVALGEQKHARQNVMQTVTATQATRVEAQLTKKARAAAKRSAARKAVLLSKLKKSGKISKNAKSLPKGYTVGPKGNLVKTKAAKNKKLAAKKARAKSSGYNKQAIQAGLKAAHSKSAVAAAAQSKKKAALKAKARKAPAVTRRVNAEWITAGNDEGKGNCTAVAIANHLLAWHGLHLSDNEVERIHKNGGDIISDAVRWLQEADPFEHIHLRYGYPTVTPSPGALVGYSVDGGRPHTGVLLVDSVISWGEILPLESEIEESWFLGWVLT